MTQTSFGPNGFEGNSYLRMSSGVAGGHSAFVPRTIQWGHNGSTSTQNITVSVSEFGFNQTGGAFYVGGHGWQTDECYAMIAYQNAGSGGGITNVRVNNLWVKIILHYRLLLLELLV